MIENVRIENFKCFSAPTLINLSQITACVGTNSVGKSSLNQALLLLRETYDILKKYQDTKRQDFTINLNDNYGLQLGDSSQIMSSKNTDTISIGFDKFVFNYKPTNDKLVLTLDTLIKAPDLEVLGSVFSPDFYYLNAERVGPRNYQNIEATEQLNCGYHGEYTYNVLNKLSSNKVSEKRLFQTQSETIAKTFSKQVESWLSFIVPGININAIPEESLRLVQMKVQQPKLDTGFISPYNFGFGISYVLPIIATGLMAPSNTMMIIENPEAHLHPCGQSRIGQFLAKVASDNIQVVIETHSEHVINGIRLACLREKIASENVCINYFSINSDSKPPHEVKRISLNERMDIVEWPNGFFDQEGLDLQELRHLRSEYGL